MNFLTTKEVLREFGINYTTISLYIRMGLVKPQKAGPSYLWSQQDIESLVACIEEQKKIREEKRFAKRAEREAKAAALAERFKSGETLAQIGVTEGVSRERIRQQLSLVRVKGADGGAHFKSKIHSAERLAYENQRREQKCQQTYGCDLQTFFSITKSNRLGRSTDLVTAYWNHRNNAVRLNTPWSITLPQYAEKIWPHASQIGRGRSHLARKDKRIGFTIDNVEIISAQEHGLRINAYKVARARNHERVQRRIKEAKALFDAGVTRKDIAKKFGVSMGAVSQWLSRARQTA